MFFNIVKPTRQLLLGCFFLSFNTSKPHSDIRDKPIWCRLHIVSISRKRSEFSLLESRSNIDICVIVVTI